MLQVVDFIYKLKKKKGTFKIRKSAFWLLGEEGKNKNSLRLVTSKSGRARWKQDRNWASEQLLMEEVGRDVFDLFGGVLLGFLFVCF